MKPIYNLGYYYKNILKIDEPGLNSEDDFFERLEINLDESYKIFPIPKKGGVREINAINRNSKLYSLQRNLNENLLSKIPVPVSCIGFIKGHGYNDFLYAHIGKKYYMRIDIKDFFGSINEKQIRDNLAEFVADCKIIDNIIKICTFKNKVPQGAVTSPVISNIIFRRVDQRIVKYCQSFEKVRLAKKNYEESILYTRYADDLLFSSDVLDFKQNRYFFKMIKKILGDNGFRVNFNKVYFSSNIISLSGHVIDKDIHLSRKRMKNINSILYYFDKRDKYEKDKYEVNISKVSDENMITKINELKIKTWNGKEVTFSNKSHLINYLCGYRSFLISFLKTNKKETDSVILIEKKIKKLEMLIDNLYGEKYRA